MYNVEPARPASPARADPVLDDKDSIRVKPAVPTELPIVEPAPKVEPASDQLLCPLPNNNNNKNVNPDSMKMDLTSGSDFYCKCSLNTGAPPKDILKRMLPLFFDERDFVSYGESLRFIVFRDTTCFVYLEDTSPSPLYTIEMEPTFKASIEDPKKPDKYSVTISPYGNNNITSPNFETILLKNKKKKIIFQFTVDVKNDKDLTQKLLTAIQNAIHHRNDSKKKKPTGVIYAQVVDQNLEKKM